MVKLQEEVGLQVVTDGEFRRGTYSDSFTRSGITGVSIEMTEDEGFSKSRHAWSSNGAAHPQSRRPHRLEGPAERRRLRLSEIGDHAHAEDHPARPVLHPLPCRSRRTSADDAYPDLDAFWADLVQAYVEEMRSLADVGCTYLQIDETSLVKLGDPRVHELLRERGDNWRDLLRTYIEVVNAVVAGAPAGMTVGIHICRSQDPSWQADVGYDPIAETLFNDMKVGTYFLEYDNARAGTFTRLESVPAGQDRGAWPGRLQGR